MADDNPDLVSPEHTRAVGLLVLAVTKLDSTITDLIGATLDVNAFEAVAAFHHQQLTGRIDTVTALLDLHLRRPKDDGQFTAIFDKLAAARSVADYRNTIVHAAWIKDDAGHPMSVRFSARGEFRRSRQTQEIGEIERRAGEAREIAEFLAGLASQFRKQTP